MLEVGTVERGKALRTLIAGKPLEQRRALAIIREVLEAVAALHAASVVHGDITPESIIVTTLGHRDRVRLADRVGTTSRDARYSAPECALGRIDARADIYSAGAVLFELLTGYPPYYATDDDALRRLHAYAPMQTLKQRAPTLSFVRALEELVAMALAKTPEARLQSVTDMIAMLDHTCQAIEELAPRQPEPPAPRHRKPNDSLLILANDLVPSQPTVPTAVIPLNVGRQVPELPWRTRALAWSRRPLDGFHALAAHSVEALRALDKKHGVSTSVRARLDRLTRPQQRILAGMVVVLVVGIVIAIV